MKLIDRAKNILTAPRREWTVIEGETTSPADLYLGYAVPLAAIPPVARWIGMSVFGFTIPLLGSYRVSFASGFARAVVEYLLSLAGVYALALVIDWLAPRFGAQPGRTAALKVAIYSSTAAWVAGIFSLVPALSILGLLGLYSLYLLFLGLPVVMKAPANRVFGYTAGVVVVAIICFVLIGIVGNMFLRTRY
jgi:hypothetical protein